MMDVQSTLEFASQYPCPPFPAAQPACRIAYIGRQFPQWADIKRSLGEWHLTAWADVDLRAILDPTTQIATDLVIVGPTDGFRGSHEICAEVRHMGYRGAVLLLTASDDAVERILGLESGADVWAAADADFRSSVAQIRALVRRARSSDEADASSRLRAGRFALNSATREVVVGNEWFDLTALEFELLWILANNVGNTVSREKLARQLGYEGVALESRAVDTAIGRLRRHLGVSNAAQIRTVRGVGYMLSAQSMNARHSKMSSELALSNI